MPIDDCFEAVLYLSENSENFQSLPCKNTQLLVQEWNFTPCGCFLWYDQFSQCGNDYYLDFDTSTTRCVADSRGYIPSKRCLCDVVN